MKTNNKILQLIKHGFSGDLLSELNEGQVNALYNRLSEQVTPLPAKPSYKVGDKGGTLPPNDKGYAIKKNPSDNSVTATPMEEEMDWLMSEDDTLDVVNDPDATKDGMGMFEEKDLQEKFESKQEQKYFFAKCGDGKTKEQKEWCKRADEFSKKTNFGKLPNKKETKEEFNMGDYYKKIASAAAGATKQNLSKISPSVNMGENQMEKKIMRLIERHILPKMSKQEFLNLVSEQGTKEKERTKEKEKTKEREHGTPYSPKPGPKKAPKAHKHEVDEQGTKERERTKEKERETTKKPGTPYSPKPGPKKAPKAGKENLPTWLSFNSIGIKLK
jgi:hypothetical protein